ncbi:50S ribosomal protein L24 [Candidatus Erwinia haradaeae]|uniref:Large ribosomal subunit protein uL24 n=1 Tax=Candidatus Erwinia haradaeae TaxID=1922217 RepID=A0A451D7Z4_9GAMM|nr:50S ribosomal protein L24 [Candidatus Erwinia haradaeae]VFP81937.1 50S ribosomal protein L24 [Candidatus Erwinia haradaeae]
MAAKIRRGDIVIVLTGRDKGKQGIVREVLVEGKVIVDGINLIKKHQKPTSSSNQSGGIITKETPIHISNVAFFNAVTGRPDRIGFRFKDGQKVRFFKSNSEIIQ